MKKYHDLLVAIKENGTVKGPARANMPGSKSLFGYQMRHNLEDGFPILTTKKMFWKGIVVELLWFLRGDTNIKYLDDHNVKKMWHEDAYNYYCKIAKANGDADQNAILQPVSSKLGIRNPAPTYDVDAYSMFTFEEFCHKINTTPKELLPSWNAYTLGDCGAQYGRTWRRFGGRIFGKNVSEVNPARVGRHSVDQITSVINSLLSNPEGRRHIVNSWSVADLDNVALHWCHAMFQFNCRKMDTISRTAYALILKLPFSVPHDKNTDWNQDEELDRIGAPKYYLDCQMYQRSADVILGVPFNIASYALLTHIIAEICNFVPGEFIHTFGDVHIYDNHKEAVDEQLSRDYNKYALPKLMISIGSGAPFWLKEFVSKGCITQQEVDAIFLGLDPSDFTLVGYESYPSIKAELSTGMK